MLAKLKNYVKNLIAPDLKYSLLKTTDKLEKLGTSYGGWLIPVNLLTSGSICYMAGAGEDISFDVELAKRFQCDVYIFDPTPRSKAHFDTVILAADMGKQTFTHANIQYYLEESIVTHLKFKEIGIWKNHDILKFYEPRDSTHVSHSITNLQKTDGYFEAPVERLSDIMRSLGHDHIDMLKLDIEGAEFPVIDSIIEDKIEIRILCIEFHLEKEKDFSQVQSTINRLVQNGYAIIAKEALDFTFIKIAK
jgi:FkbM family methyltransferase